MSELVFATFAQELKSAFRKRINNPDLIMLLYDAVALPANLHNKNNDVITVSKTTASNIMNRNPRGKILDCIREHSKDDAVVENIETYFSDCVVSEILSGKEEQVINNVVKLIKNDLLITETQRGTLLSYADLSHLAKFLGNTYLYTLSVPNAKREIKARTLSAPLNEPVQKNRKQHPLPLLPIPDTVGTDERKYIQALMEVYAEETGKENFKFEDLDSYPKQKEHFCRQRADFFAAEAVRRETRDIYDDDEKDEVFNVFLSEIHAGVIDVYEDDYQSGIKRLKEVLVAAVRTPTDQCKLTRETFWIGNPQKKGACHFLVNRGIFKGWVICSAESI